MKIIMRYTFLSIIVFLAFNIAAKSQDGGTQRPPYKIASGEQGNRHVQGIAVDKKNGFVYFSFTDKLIKTDWQGNLLGSVTGYVGHLGCIDFDPATNTVYGSLEYKNDAIVQNKTNVFYIAMFDGAKIDKENMNGEDSNVMKAVYLDEVVKDYETKVVDKGKVVDHRYGCSGIDGTTIGPAFGMNNSADKFLYVAYGIYGDTSRDDNDNQVILKYDLTDLKNFAKGLFQASPHRSGPQKPLDKYFIRTGNTRYGIQNLKYDPFTGNFFVAVYNGQKSQFPNYGLFVIDGHQPPHQGTIVSDGKREKVKKLSLVDSGLKDASTGISGWYFNYGSTGIAPLGEGLFYISHNKKSKDGGQETTLYKYRWIGKGGISFELIPF